MTMHLTLENFEGPLDLLLHLIEQDELDIYDIPIGRVTEQYLRYLDDIDLVDVERAGEFLVMAATLCQIKARMLLPRPVVDDETLIPGLEPGDPRAELILRLLDYSRFRQVAELLNNMASERSDAFPRWQEGKAPELVPIVTSPAGSVDLSDLLNAWQALVERRRPAPVRRIDREPVTVGECMDRIRRAVSQAASGLTFQSLFPEDADRNELVTTFLALLELLRLHELSVWQDGPLSEIHLYRWGHSTSD